MRQLAQFAIASFIMVLASCASTRPTPLWDRDCPFQRLNFTAGTEKDTLMNTLSINDTLVAALQADLSELKKSGKVGNNLVLAVNRVRGKAVNNKLDITDEYFQLYNNKTTALCGLNDLLRTNKTLRNQASKDKAETLLLEIVDDLRSFSDKKKQQQTTK